MKHGVHRDKTTGDWHVVYRVPGFQSVLSSVFVCPTEAAAKSEARRLNVLHDREEAVSMRQTEAQLDRRLVRGWYTDEDGR